jgi:hypothetical protein
MVLPYTIDISDDRLAAIKAKVEAYDWSQLPDAGGWTSGVGVNDLKRPSPTGEMPTIGARSNTASTSFPTSRPRSRVSEYTSSMYGAVAPSLRFFFSTAGRAHFLNLNVCSIRLRQMGTMSLSPRFQALPSPNLSPAS